MQALLANFIYFRRTEDTFVKGQEALIYLRDENQKLVVQLAEANSTLGKATEMMASSHDSLEKMEGYKKTRDEEVAKLRDKLLTESASHKEAWKALEEERRIH